MTSQLRDALASLADDAPIVRVPPRLYRTARHARRRRWSVVLGAVGVVGVLLCGSVAFAPPDTQVADGRAAGLPERLVAPRWWTETVRSSPNGPASVVFTAGKGNVQADFDDFQLEWWREGRSVFPSVVVGLQRDTYRIDRASYSVGVELSPDGRYLLTQQGVQDLTRGSVSPQPTLSESSSAGWSADGRWFISVDRDMISVVSWPSGHVDWQLPLAIESIGAKVPDPLFFYSGVALSSDGSLLAVQAGGELRVYRRDGSVLWQQDVGRDQIAGRAAWRADGRLAMLRRSDVVCPDCPARVWPYSSTWQLTNVNGLTGASVPGKAVPTLTSANAVEVVAWRGDTAYCVVNYAGRTESGPVALVRLVPGTARPQSMLTAPAGTEDMNVATDHLDTIRPAQTPSFGVNRREVLGWAVTLSPCALAALLPVLIPILLLLWRRRRDRRFARDHPSGMLAWPSTRQPGFVGRRR
jgi:hypothetical protein